MINSKSKELFVVEKLVIAEIFVKYFLLKLKK